MNSRSDGMVAVIPGGAGALGSAVTSEFLAEGWQVLVTSSPSSLSRLVDSLDRASVDRLRGIEADVSTPEGSHAISEAARHHFGGAHALVNLVGGFAGGHALTETPVEEWDSMMTLNVKTAFLCCRSIIPVLAESGGGSIVNIGSKMAESPSGNFVAYSVSKASCVALTKALADELKAMRIRVNCVLPGTMDTPANRKSMPTADRGKWVQTADVAKLIVYLCSPISSQTSGAIIPVYGQG